MSVKPYEVTGFSVLGNKPYYCFDCVQEEAMESGKLQSELLRPIHKFHTCTNPQYCNRCGRGLDMTVVQFCK